MPVVIVVGVQWGDEGKGKLVDYLTERADLVVRFQGGHNAGHTVVVEGQKTALSLIPSGILRAKTRCLIAAGVVVDGAAFFREVDRLGEAGIKVTPERLGIAAEAQLILPYHQAIDLAREESLAAGKIGTTGKGIGPAYEDHVGRAGIRLIDLFDEDALYEMVKRNVTLKNHILEALYQSPVRFDVESVFNELVKIGERLKPYITNVSLEVDNAISKNQLLVFEGAQGSLLDISHGNYPYVTSSHTVAGFACVSAGFSPKAVDTVLGICKAYSTRVGSGPFPTEDKGADGEVLRVVGKEFGTVTGRPRRCGWFDAMAVRRTLRLSGVESVVLTKLDVLSGFETIRVGVSYTLDGKKLNDLPASSRDIERVQVEYQEFPGWKEDITEVRSLDELPETARQYIAKLEELMGCPVGGFSVGPGREQTIILDKEIRRFAE